MDAWPQTQVQDGDRPRLPGRCRDIRVPRQQHVGASPVLFFVRFPFFNLSLITSTSCLRHCSFPFFTSATRTSGYTSATPTTCRFHSCLFLCSLPFLWFNFLFTSLLPSLSLVQFFVYFFAPFPFLGSISCLLHYSFL